MLKSFATGLGVAAAALVISIAPAVAQETFTLRPMLIADIGRDVDAVRGTSSYSPARIVDTGIRPEVPAIARLSGAYGDVIVRIEMTAEGKLSGAALAHSSGNRSIDADALKTARALTYTPAKVGGRGIADSYLLDLDYTKH